MDPSGNTPATVRILVVDDHPGTAMTLARAIAQIGPQVEAIHACSGKDAIERVSGDSVDVLITDMMMPGMNGLELIDRMQSNPGGRPAHIILITAYDVPGLKETARRLKVDETIIKPVRPERICQIVGNIIKSMGPAPAAPAPEVQKQPFKILIADDMPDNVTLLTRYMQNEGYAYITASTGVETIDKTRAEMPDLVLLDVNMPDKDGFAVLEEMRADSALEHIPVIILTAARLHPNDVQAGLNLGADDYITKPFDRRELFARIRAKLRTKSFEDTIRSRNRQLSMLPEIGKELSARLDMDELANVVLRHTVETLGALVGHIVLFDTRHSLQKTRHASSTSGYKAECPRMDGFVDEINESRNSLIVNNVREEPRWQSLPDDPARSAIIVPMFGRDHLLGLLVLAHERTGYFQMEHLLLLQAIASQAAIAMENALLYEDLVRQQKSLSVVLHSAAEAIFLFDADGRLSLINPAGENLFTDFNTSLNRPLERGQGYDPLIELLEQARESVNLKSGEIGWPDGRTFAVLITPIEGGGLVAVLHDVTSFKQVERVKNEFIAAASHDLKNPLTSIAGFSQLLAQAGPLNDMQTDFVHHIQTAAHTMSELVQSLVQLAQADLNASQKHEPVEMGMLLAEMVDEFTPQAVAKGQTLKFDQLAAPEYVNGDALQLKQLFRNLIGNAIKYTQQGGSVVISTNVETENVRVVVQDTGYGIPAADLPFVFDRFYRVRNEKHNEVEGNGLGLSIVKSIAEQHNGRVTVQSEPDRGSLFSISLPLLSDAGFESAESAQTCQSYSTDSKGISP
jgi:signal transduction histidine kinase/DNA-binding response OmpR family regulator